MSVSDASTSSVAAVDAVHDSKLIARFVAGDEKAFVEIVQRHYSKIFATTLGMLRNRADAEEITQDTFLRALRGLKNFRGDSSLSTWLHRIAVNLARNRYWYFFRRRRQDSLSLDHQLSEESSATFADLIADESSDAGQKAVMSEFESLAELAVQRLSESDQQILALRNNLHCSYERISEMLDINVGTVKSRIARSRERLRRQIELMSGERCDEDGFRAVLTPRTGGGATIRMAVS